LFVHICLYSFHKCFVGFVAYPNHAHTNNCKNKITVVRKKKEKKKEKEKTEKKKTANSRD
jgi:hypothetical protein